MSQTEQALSPDAFMAVLKGRRSIRKYRPDPVPEEMVEQLLEAGRWAPSASNRQPWRFIVVRDEQIRNAVARHAGIAVIRFSFVDDAPLLIVLLGDRSNPVYRTYLHEDVGLAGSQIMLQAHAMGLGTCWLGGIDKDAIARILGVPQTVEIVGMLTVGFPAESPNPRPRKPLEDLFYTDVYGNRDGAGASAADAGWWKRLLSRLRFNFVGRE